MNSEEKALRVPIATDISQVFEKFGKYQLEQYFFACVAVIFVNIIHINFVFVAGDVNYRCRIPECDGTPPFSLHPPWWPDDSIDRCSRPVYNFTFGTCTKSSFTAQTELCSEWVYESKNTIVAELDLACSPLRSYLVGTIHNVGMLISALIAGWTSDRFGRKITLVVFSVGGCIGHLKAFASSYNVFLVVEFLEALLAGGVNTAAMVTMIEMTGRKHRLLAGVLFAYANYLGETVFGVIATYVPYWKNIVRIIYTPPIFFLTYIFFFRESARWQILHGKSEQAKETIRRIAKMNKLEINQQNLESMNESQLRDEFNIGQFGKTEGFKKIFTSQETVKRLIVGATCVFTGNFVYVGLMINSVFLPGDKYINFLLVTIASFPGQLVSIYVMNKVGRKLPLLLGFILSGILCVASAYVPSERTWVMLTLFLLSKLVIALCYTGAVTYIMELFPTSGRGKLLGLCSFASRAGGMLAPLTPMLLQVSPALPSICFCGSAIITALLMTLTPETKNLPLPDTIDQIETVTKGNS